MATAKRRPAPDRITEEERAASPDRPKNRQAVVIIHGVGDQQPMTTLRRFVTGLFTDAAGDRARFFSKPDRLSDTLELRRIYVGESVAGRPTDFYELYWAHLIAGTTLQHIADWFFLLLRQRRQSVPARLRWIWAASWLLALAALVSAAMAAWTASARPALGATGLLALIFVGGRWIARRFALSHIGDAARYFRRAPENIAIRAAIRRAGLEIVRRLHEDPLQRYERIVLVGHSLGSVIAYDVITHLWQEMHWKHNKPSDPAQVRFEAMRSHLEANQGRAGDIDTYRDLQRRLLAEERKLGMPWKITDLVTLGSPLTYADFLLADEHYGLDERRADRELPTCPPQLEDGRDIGFLSARYFLGNGKLSRKKELHHAAPFACTRWTNLYFKSDIVGGPLAGLLGDGIKDVVVPPAGRLAKTYAAHVRYWFSSEPEACLLLKESLKLGEAPDPMD